MYTVGIETTFSAVHGLRLPGGGVEQRHGHEWRIRAQFARPWLDSHEMVVDFDVARAALDSIVARLGDTDLNTLEQLGGRNPTAELLARYVFERLRERGFSTVSRVEVTEAPGCIAVYEACTSREECRTPRSIDDE